MSAPQCYIIRTLPFCYFLAMGRNEILMKCNQAAVNGDVDNPCLRTYFIFISVTLKAFSIIL